MYDYNIQDTKAGGYIANRTHWKEIKPTEPICGGDQRFYQSYDGSVWSYIKYTEKVGLVYAPNQTTQIQVNGPTYLEAVYISDTDNPNIEVSYHLTPVFTHKLPVGSWNAAFPASTVDRTLIDVVAFGERDKCGRRTYYDDDTNGNRQSKWNAVHIKKTPGLFENDEEFVAYCQQQLGEINYENGPTAAQQAKAKEILDTYAYSVCGGWLWITYDSTSNSSSKMYTLLINPSETYKQYWQCRDRYADVETIDGVQNWYNLKHYSKRATGFTRNYNNNTYTNPAKDGWFGVSIIPELDWVWKSGEEVPSYMNDNINSSNMEDSLFIGGGYGTQLSGTWTDIGQVGGVATWNPIKYHRLDIHYMPDEIRQMMGEIRMFRNATYHQEMH